MKLPVAMQTAMDRSEKQFQDILDRLGLTRGSLTKVANRIKNENEPKQIRPKPDTNAGRRTYHV